MIPRPDVRAPTPLLDGLSPAQFMRRHWQKRPLLVRQAWPGVRPPVARAQLFALAARDDVESRLIVRQGEQWSMRHGPLPRRALPPLRQRQWTLLVQGLDLHDDAAHDMLARFRFVADARLDDLMISYASDGGGVGPHLDSYDVFLLQVHGRRRWRIGRVADRSLVEAVPVKILRHFEPEHDWLLEAGDMLYLPPLWGHDGVAEGECMTCSIGLRAPSTTELGRELLMRLADTGDSGVPTLYRDAGVGASEHPAAIPDAMRHFAWRAAHRLMTHRQAGALALGELLTEPKPNVWFEPGSALGAGSRPIRLDRRTRMMYERRHLFINGETHVTAGNDARILRRLADDRCIDRAAMDALSRAARALLQRWAQAGWLHEC